jgi:hypothetical protein
MTDLMSYQITVTRTLDSVPVDDNRYACKVTETTLDSREEQPTKKSWQAITTAEGLKNLKIGRPDLPVYAPGHDDDKHYTLHFGVLSDASLRKLQKQGVGLFQQKRCREKQNVFDRLDIYDHVVRQGSLDNIIGFVNYDSTAWRLDGTLLPTAHSFDYMDGHMNNAHYDLPKALAILQNRSDVTLTVRERWGNDGYIQQVPGYNAGDSCGTQYISFRWIPNQEQADVLHGVKGSLDTHKTIFDQDMLGLRAGGAALFSSFYEHVEDKSDDSDENEEDWDLKP